MENELLDEVSGEISAVDEIDGDIEDSVSLDGEVEVPASYVEAKYEVLMNDLKHFLMEEYSEMPYVKVMYGNEEINFDMLLPTETVLLEFNIVNDEGLKHRFILVELYNNTLTDFSIISSTLLSIDSLIEFSFGAIIPIVIIQDKVNPLLGNVRFNINENNEQFSISVYLSVSEKTEIAESIYIRARYVN